ncbi:hypothetical protein [Roseibium sp. MB-4]
MKKPHPEWMENCLFWATAIWAVISFVAGLIVVVVILFTADYMGGPEQRARAFTPVLGFFLAALTFLTVMWRGMINTRQAHEDKRQNDSRDKADQAILLEKAAGFLSANDLATRGTGLAMLETIVRAPDGLYSQYALELATDQLVPCFENDGDGKSAVIERIYAVLQAGHEREIWPKYRRIFEFKENTKFRNPMLQLTNWTPVSKFVGAFFHLGAAEIECLNSEKAKHWSFERCKFAPRAYLLNSRVKPLTVSDHFHQCTFRQIPIGRIEDFYGIYSENVFTQCDLSNAVFGELSDIQRNKFSKCFYREGHQPKLQDDPVDEEEVEFRRFLRGLQERKRLRSKA